MGKALVIAEKPSVATDISKALGGLKREKDYFEGEEYVVTSAVGHLLEIKAPDDFEVKRGKWSLANLPVLPPRFELNPIEKTESRLKQIGKFLRRKDIDTVINACDAGREGELIFRYIAQFHGNKKPIKRLWLQSMTPGAIRAGFERLRTDEELQPLASAAACRSEADWLIGINGTRAMTAFNSKLGGFQLTPVGRVQTPTLTIVVEREEKIKKHVPRTYWEVHATFEGSGGPYSGVWFDEAFKKVKDGDPDLRADRIWENAKAQSIVDHVQGKTGIVEEKSKPSSQSCPLLYDLTTLQRDANGRFGMAASSTLKIAQALYERHKVITYPRTDSKALPEDYLATVKKTMDVIRGGEAAGRKVTSSQWFFDRYGRFADKALANDWIRPNKRIFNDSKISDHFAIIPTTLPPKKLSEPEEKLYDLIVKRFLGIFYPPAEYQITTRITRVENEPFKTEGKVLVKAGWLEVYGKTTNQVSSQGSKDELAPVEPGETVNVDSVELRENATKPPPRYTEATLLSAMESAGKLVEDDELREAMREKGLGTPATRASIIEGLLREQYLEREARELKPSAKAFSLIVLLRALKIPGLNSPEMTGDWEYRLSQIERNQLQPEEFMRDIAAMTKDIVERTKQYESDTVPGDFGELKEPCPVCGGVIKETYKKFQCKDCDFATWKILAGRQLEIEEMETLIREKTIGPLQGFRSKMGRAFNAVLKMTDENKVEFDFGENNNDSSKDIDFSELEAIGVCPKCKSSVYDTPMAYLCEKASGAEKSCDFRVGKIILQREIEQEQAKKLLTEGKTALLEKFVSKKNGRPFSAFLVMKEDGKVGFEFAPKAKKTTKKATSKKVASSETDSKSE